jgi:hypothetical protein
LTRNVDPTVLVILLVPLPCPQSDASAILPALLL